MWCLSGVVKITGPCFARQNLECSSKSRLSWYIYRNFFRLILFHSYHPPSKTGQFCLSTAQVVIKGWEWIGLECYWSTLAQLPLLLLAMFSLLLLFFESCCNSTAFWPLHRGVCYDDRFANWSMYKQLLAPGHVPTYLRDTTVVLERAVFCVFVEHATVEDWHRATRKLGDCGARCVSMIG